MTDAYSSNQYWVDNSTWFIDEAPWKLQTIEKALSSYMALCNGKVRTLDIGGGAGLIGKGVAIALELCGLDVEQWAIDLSPEAVAVQLRCNAGLKRAWVGDICNSTISDDAVDLAIAVDVVEHTSYPPLALFEIARVARYAILKIPIERCLLVWLWDIVTNGKKRRKALEERYGHDHTFRYGDIKRVVEMYCGDIVSIYLCNEHINHSRIDRTRLSRWIHQQASVFFRVSPLLTAWLLGDSAVVLVRCHKVLSDSSVGLKWSVVG